MDASFPLPPALQAMAQDLGLDELVFEPVPVRARRDGWTPERQRGFIHRLALIGCVSAAARAVGKSRESAYRLRDRPGAESFAAAWDQAHGWGRSFVLDLTISRALEGEVRPIFYRGRQVGEQVRYDNRLLMASLKTLPPAPECYGDPLDILQRFLDANDPARRSEL
jgi:hypothetical protein